MKEIGLLFTAPMVNAILAGRKSQTRRLKFNGKPGDRIWVRETWLFGGSRLESANPDVTIYTAKYKDGTSQSVSLPSSEVVTVPKHRCKHLDGGLCGECSYGYWRRWQPSIFMPRWASRITLEVVEVREQRLWDITCEDVEAEGVCGHCPIPNCQIMGDHPFVHLWNQINGVKGRAWSDNPVVFAVTFRVVK